MNSHKTLNPKQKNFQSGQMTLEMVLLLVALFGFVSFASTQLKEQEVLKQFITSPWVAVSNMMQSGVWNINREEAKRNHPGYWKRMYGLKGKPPP